MEQPDDQPEESELLGPELAYNEIADIKALFQSVVDSISLKYCCADILYANYKKFTAIIQRKHAPDIMIQLSDPLTSNSDKLRLRVELFGNDTHPGMTGLDYVKPKNNVNEHPVRDTAARSIVIAAGRDSLNTTLRQLLVKLKYTLIAQSRISPEDIPGAEGQSDYSLSDFDVIFVGEDSLWADEATPETRRDRFPSVDDL